MIEDRSAASSAEDGISYPPNPHNVIIPSSSAVPILLLRARGGAPVFNHPFLSDYWAVFNKFG